MGARPVFQPHVFGAEELDAAAARGLAVLPRHEKGDAFAHELLNAEPVAALLGIEWVKNGFEVGNELRGIGAIRTFLENHAGLGHLTGLKNRLAASVT